MLRSLGKKLTPGLLAILVGAGWALAGRLACARRTEIKNHAEEVKAVLDQKEIASRTADEEKAKAESWKVRAMGAEAVAEKLRKAPRITDQPESAGVSAIKAGEIAGRDGLLIDSGLGADAAAALVAWNDDTSWKNRFEHCLDTNIILRKKTGFWPSVKKYGIGALFGAAVVLAVEQ